jgi:hypothetical protein
MKMFKGPGFSRRNFLAGTGAAAVALKFGSQPASAAGQLNVYNWDTYIGETTLQTFTDSTGVEVQYDLYANLEEMFAKFQAGNPGYDVIFPSDYMMETMIAAGMLEELDIRAASTTFPISGAAAVSATASPRSARSTAGRSCWTATSSRGAWRCSPIRASSWAWPCSIWAIPPTPPTRTRSTPPATS